MHNLNNLFFLFIFKIQCVKIDENVILFLKLYYFETTVRKILRKLQFSAMNKMGRGGKESFILMSLVLRNGKV